MYIRACWWIKPLRVKPAVLVRAAHAHALFKPCDRACSVPLWHWSILVRFTTCGFFWGHNKVHSVNLSAVSVVKWSRKVAGNYRFKIKIDARWVCALFLFFFCFVIISRFVTRSTCFGYFCQIVCLVHKVRSMGSLRGYCTKKAKPSNKSRWRTGLICVHLETKPSSTIEGMQLECL